jgi:hypothetical protein
MAEWGRTAEFPCPLRVEPGGSGDARRLPLVRVVTRCSRRISAIQIGFWSCPRRASAGQSGEPRAESGPGASPDRILWRPNIAGRHWGAVRSGTPTRRSGTRVCQQGSKILPRSRPRTTEAHEGDRNSVSRGAILHAYAPGGAQAAEIGVMHFARSAMRASRARRWHVVRGCRFGCHQCEYRGTIEQPGKQVIITRIRRKKA